MSILRLLLVLILSPFILLGATILVCIIIGSGWEMICKVAIIAVILCLMKYVWSICGKKVEES